jgi:hypothetical protein
MHTIKVDWITFKNFVDERSISIQFLDAKNTYYLYAFDGPFHIYSAIYKDNSAEQIEFESNYKALGNKSVTSEVVTQFEKNDKSLKLVSDYGEINLQTGQCVLLLRVPGIPGQGKRFVASGMAWFENPELLDRVMVYISDEDNLLGQGAGIIIGSYTDDEAEESKRGWFIPPGRGYADAQAIGGYGELPSGFYLKIIGIKQTPAIGGKFFCNIEWGKQDGAL